MAAEMTPLEIAKKILEIANTGMHIKDIAIKAIESGLTSGIPNELVASRINAALGNSVNRDNSPFARVKNPKDKTKFLKGQYRLKRVVAKQIDLPIPEPTQSEDTGHIGRGGEYAVMSELLFRGFNVSLMSVDKGVDVVAANDNGKYFHVQVKTATGKEGTFYATVKRKSFEANNSSQTFYVFVLRKDSRNDFIIFPSNLIATYIGAGLVKGVDSLGFKFVYDGKTRKHILNNTQDVALFTNRWAMLC